MPIAMLLQTLSPPAPVLTAPVLAAHVLAAPVCTVLLVFPVSSILFGCIDVYVLYLSYFFSLFWVIVFPVFQHSLLSTLHGCSVLANRASCSVLSTHLSCPVFLAVSSCTTLICIYRWFKLWHTVEQDYILEKGLSCLIMGSVFPIIFV